MLYTYRANTDALAAVTHVNGTARLQTVSPSTNAQLHDLLVAFKARTGYGVLCNTSLNFNGKGFINNLTDLDTYTADHELDGFVVEGRAYLLRSSERYRAYLADYDPGSARSEERSRKPLILRGIGLRAPGRHQPSIQRFIGLGRRIGLRQTSKRTTLCGPTSSDN